MTIQITVRLPDDQVTFLDQQVAEGVVASRAAGVARAIRREQHRLRAERDLQTLAAAPSDDDLASLQDWAAGRELPPLD